MAIMKAFAKFLSILFHPVFWATLGLAYILFVSENAVFVIPDGKEIQWLGMSVQMQWLLIAAYTTLFMPLLVIFLLWRLKFIQSVQMKTAKERYVPLIACMSFYFWVFWVFHQNLEAPAWIQMFLLSCFLTMVFSFLLTIFSKISLHLAGTGGVLGYALLLNVSTDFQDALFLMAAMLIFILLWFSRKILGAHNTPQLVVGSVLGLLSSLIAYLIF